MCRDDGLSYFQNLSGLEAEKKKKKLWKILKQHGLNITEECNLRITDFLYVTFDLRTRKYYLCRKVNNELLYICKQSNHPPSITMQFLPWSVKEYPILHVIKSALIKLPLINITHLKTVVSTKVLTSRHNLLKEKERCRNILLFNSPFNSNVTTNTTKMFLWLLDKLFPTHHKYYKLFNRKNVKISYSCMQNMASVIQNYNTNLLKDPAATAEK